MQTNSEIFGEGQPLWYCLRAKLKQEHLAAANVSALTGVTAFCPRLKVKQTRRGNVIWVTEALFPGYLFARFDFATLHRLVRYAHGVNDIVRFGLRYPTVDERVMTELFARTESGEEAVDPMRPGCPVEIIAGAFYGLHGVVLQVLPAKQRVKILLDFLGRQMVAELDSKTALPTAEAG